MTIRIHFERSEAVAEAHGFECGRTTVEFDSSDGSWVQLTYNTLRTQDGGDIIAFFDDVNDCWIYDSEPFSDVVVEFVA